MKTKHALVTSPESWACASRLAAFFNALDDRDYETQVAQMSRRGTWHRRGEPLEGRDAVLAAMAGRRENVDIRHVMTNEVVRRGPDGLEMECYVTAFRTGIDDTPPPNLEAPVALFRFRARFEEKTHLIVWLRGEILQRRR